MATLYQITKAGKTVTSASLGTGTGVGIANLGGGYFYILIQQILPFLQTTWRLVRMKNKTLYLIRNILTIGVDQTPYGIDIDKKNAYIVGDVNSIPAQEFLSMHNRNGNTIKRYAFNPIGITGIARDRGRLYSISQTNSVVGMIVAQAGAIRFTKTFPLPAGITTADRIAVDKKYFYILHDNTQMTQVTKSGNAVRTLTMGGTTNRGITIDDKFIYITE